MYLFIYMYLYMDIMDMDVSISKKIFIIYLCVCIWRYIDIDIGIDINTTTHIYIYIIHICILLYTILLYIFPYVSRAISGSCCFPLGLLRYQNLLEESPWQFFMPRSSAMLWQRYQRHQKTAPSKLQQVAGCCSLELPPEMVLLGIS